MGSKRDKKQYPPDSALITKITKDNPYKGLMAVGWEMFQAGKPCPHRVGTSRGKSYAMYQGWIKAKLAKEQGKRSL